jgi:hypothetical protein
MLFIRSPVYLIVDAMLNPDPFDDHAFNREVWLDQYEEWGWGNPRGRMAYSVRDMLIGSDMTLKEVIDLLGLPEISNGPNSIKYLLGPWSGFRIDPDFLLIRFDEHERVKEALIMGS